ncbi:hypothetical protein [Sinisalibacter aestuarii]|uniref:EF-hand domain-containing protein n=1 Tax=Sinisalibacter aestuarii TaxID=2949426 RepID=A0ABQ5LQK8_9RHOB|nr:hypothetical protein [Sinisalibacter aestuarii]GKY87289.1 hypothetical protein STA1M1_11580 [Sinisalibacter aestuarii]
MTSLSPLSVVSALSPAANMLGTLAGEVAEAARGKDGLAGAFSDAFAGLDANDDGRLSAGDAVGHVAKLRNAVLGGIVDVFGVDKDEPDQRPTAGVRAGGLAGPTPLSAAATPALPSAPAAQAVENLPGLAEIRATYATLRLMH